MSWFFIALGAPFLWALTNIADQYLVAKYSVEKRGSGGLVLFSSLIGIVIAIFIGIFMRGIFDISFVDKLLLVGVGGITILWVILYLFALEGDDVSSIVPWFLTIPVFGYILGYFFLDENLSLMQFIGAGVILIGVLIISVDFSGTKRKFKWASVSSMLLACFLIAVAGVIFKYVTVGEDFWVSSFWEYAGLGSFGILIYVLVPKYRKDFILMNKKGGAQIFILNTASELATVAGNLLTTYAFLLAPVVMVYLVSSFQPAIVLFLTIFLTKFFPSIVREDLKGKVLLPKILAIIIMTAGSVILFS